MAHVILERLQNHFGEGPVSPQDVRDLLRKLKVEESLIDCALQAFEADEHLTWKGLVSWIFDCSEARPVNHHGISPKDLPDAAEPAKARARKIREALEMTAERFADYMHLLAKFPRRCEIARTELRGITLKQLRVVEDFIVQHAGEWWLDVRSKRPVDPATANLYHVSTWLIMPATSTADCAWVELAAGGEQRPQWFCSHWWGEPVRDFIGCVAKHKEVRCFKTNPGSPKNPEDPVWAHLG